MKCVESQSESQSSESKVGGLFESSSSRFGVSEGCGLEKNPASQVYFRQLSSLVRVGLGGAVGSAINATSRGFALPGYTISVKRIRVNRVVGNWSVK